MTLTRRDRAALTLALHVLRSCGANAVHEALWPLGWVPDVYDAVEAAHAHGVPTRLLRARLALLLRVLLRVDKDDLRRWRCPEHGRRVAWDWHDGHGEEWWCAECRRWRIVKIDPPTCHIRPLWEIAAREAGR
jgi:hypothetical protein